MIEDFFLNVKFYGFSFKVIVCWLKLKLGMDGFRCFVCCVVFGFFLISWSYGRRFIIYV